MLHYLKGLLFLVFIVSFISCSSDFCSKESCKQNSKEVTDVLQNQFAAWNSGSLEKFMEGYEKSDSIQFITSKGRVWGWKNVYDKYKKHYSDKEKMGKLTFDDMSVKFLNKNLAQVYGKWQVQNDTVFGGVFSVLLRKKKAGWKIFIDHTW